MSAELERQSYFLPYKHPEQIKKEGNVHWKGLTLNHPPTQRSPTALVAMATEEEVGIFKLLQLRVSWKILQRSPHPVIDDL